MKKFIKKIHGKGTFLGFLRDYYKLEDITIYQRLKWSRQRYYQFLDGGYVYPLTPAKVMELSIVFKVPLESMQGCVSKYLIK